MDDKKSFSIKYWSDDDKPREKMLLKGKQALSDAELLAILIGSGSREESAVDLCKKILIENDNNLGILGKKSVQELMKYKGIGEAKSIAIVAALELGRRRRLEDAKQSFTLSSSKSVYEYMQPIIGDLPYEEFWVLMLNNANKIINKIQISKGGITGTVVDVRLLFKQVLEQYAVAIIIVHNHPSGRLKPSTEDIRMTEKIKEAAKILDIKLLDHLIITEKDYYSFSDEGLL